jgi:hypothetical protein
MGFSLQCVHLLSVIETGYFRVYITAVPLKQDSRYGFSGILCAFLETHLSLLFTWVGDLSADCKILTGGFV